MKGFRLYSRCERYENDPRAAKTEEDIIDLDYVTEYEMDLSIPKDSLAKTYEEKNEIKITLQIPKSDYNNEGFVKIRKWADIPVQHDDYYRDLAVSYKAAGDNYRTILFSHARITLRIHDETKHDFVTATIYAKQKEDQFVGVVLGKDLESAYEKAREKVANPPLLNLVLPGMNTNYSPQTNDSDAASILLPGAYFDNWTRIKCEFCELDIINPKDIIDVYKSKQDPGKFWDDSKYVTAEDLLYKDSSLDDIKNLNIEPNPMDWAFFSDEIKKNNPRYTILVDDFKLEYKALPLYEKVIKLGKAVSDRNPDDLFKELKALAEFSTFIKPFSDNRELVLQFIEHFKSGTGSDFRDDKLDKLVEGHTVTKTYARQFVAALENSIERNQGEIFKADGDGDDRTNKDKEFQAELNELIRPKFNTFWSKTDGTFFMMDDTHGMTVDVLDYVFCKKCNNYKGKLRLNIYDHFGLDQGDVEKYATAHWGVYGWYVLQHYEGFNKSQYNPFITRTTAEYEIGSGRTI